VVNRALSKVEAADAAGSKLGPPPLKSYLSQFANARIQSSLGQLAAYLGLFLIVAYFKGPVLFKDPRFWAEEGTFYYANCLGHTFSDCLGIVQLGSYQLLENLMVYVAARAPILRAPAATTFLSLVVQLGVVGQIVQFSQAYRLPTMVTALLVLAWALLPATYEVGLSATNVQWVAGVSVLWVLVMPTEWLVRHRKGVIVWCAICGLSGVPGVLLAPIFFLRALFDRSRTMLAIALVLGACAIFQLVILARFGTSAERSLLSHDAITLVTPFFLQTVWSPILSVDVASALGQALIAQRTGSGTIPLGIILAGLGVVTVVVAAAWSYLRSPLVPLTVVGWALVTLVQSFGGLGPPEMFLSGWLGGRYFLFGSVCLCILLAWGTRARVGALRMLASGLLACVVLSGAAQAKLSVWQTGMLSGPSWRQQVRACPVGIPCRVAVWGGPAWVLDIVK
jgi:hypothetical protein